MQRKSSTHRDKRSQLSKLRWSALFALGLTTSFIVGCPQSTKKAYLRCSATKGSPCFGQQWTTKQPRTQPKAAWNTTPHFWRYRHEGKTVGVLLLGHPKDMMISALGHTLHTAMNEGSSPKGFLATGAMYAMYSQGVHTKPREKALLNMWDGIFDYLNKAKRVIVKDAPAVPIFNQLRLMRAQIADFHQSSQHQTILYFHRDQKKGPLVVPYLSIGAPPEPYVLRLPHKSLPTDRAKILGKLFFRLRMRKALPTLQQLWREHYAHNLKIEKLLFPARMRCHYKWYKLFQAKKRSIATRHAHVFIDRPVVGSPNKGLRVVCNKSNIEELRREPKVVRQLRLYRKELHSLNAAFRRFSYYHTAAKKHFAIDHALNASIAVDGILRKHTLYYPQKVSINNKLVDPATLFGAWQKKFYKDAWQGIHKQAQENGQYLTTQGKGAGIFDIPNTVYWTLLRTNEYKIVPHAILQGDFAVALDRRRGVIEIITNHKPYPFVGRRSLTQNKKGSAKPTSLRQKIEQAARGKLTIVHAGIVRDIPHPAPTLPPRTFLFKEKYLWLRLDHTLTVIPTTGANALKAPVQRAVIEQVEAAMAKRDAIPQHVKVLTISGNTPQLQITFPGDPSQ